MTTPNPLITLAECLSDSPWAGEPSAPDVPLAPYVTWRVGGPADLLCTATKVEGLVAAIQAARVLGIPWRVLGRGSNVLVGDEGVAGLVILNRTADLRIEPPLVTADGGVLLSTLARRTAAVGLAGLEWSAGIPGSVGGAVVSNAGAHGGCVADTLLPDPPPSIGPRRDRLGEGIDPGSGLSDTAYCCRA